LRRRVIFWFTDFSRTSSGSVMAHCKIVPFFKFIRRPGDGPGSVLYA
jgi:hypothetical protein